MVLAAAAPSARAWLLECALMPGQYYSKVQAATLGLPPLPLTPFYPRLNQLAPGSGVDQQTDAAAKLLVLRPGLPSNHCWLPEHVRARHGRMDSQNRAGSIRGILSPLPRQIPASVVRVLDQRGTERECEGLS